MNIKTKSHQNPLLRGAFEMNREVAKKSADRPARQREERPLIVMGSLSTKPFVVEETTIADIHAAYRNGSMTCVKMTQAYLDRIAAYDQAGPALNSYVTLNPKALERAAELDAIYAQTGKFVGPLHGVPFGIKDQAEAMGCGSAAQAAPLFGVLAVVAGHFLK